jgi:hypothetical protein
MWRVLRDMRIILYTGMGGVGKTSETAATVLRVADLSLDDPWGIDSSGASLAIHRMTAFARGPF